MQPKELQWLNDHIKELEADFDDLLTSSLALAISTDSDGQLKAINPTDEALELMDECIEVRAKLDEARYVRRQLKILRADTPETQLLQDTKAVYSLLVQLVLLGNEDVCATCANYHNGTCGKDTSPHNPDDQNFCLQGIIEYFAKGENTNENPYHRHKK